jgi:potassium-transporting ATPase potassium-binding subunit
VHQTITGGTLASQAIIEQLGVNGGGFVAANVASPNLNPTPLSDLLQFFAMFLLGAALTNMFGRIVGNVRHGWVLVVTALTSLPADALGPVAEAMILRHRGSF